MRRLLTLAVAVALLAVACSTGVEEAEEAYCESAQTWVEAQAAVRDIGPGTSREDAQAAFDALDSAYDDLVVAADDYSEARISEIESARETFQSEMDRLTDSVSFAEGQVIREDAFVALFASVKSTLDTQCA